MNIVGWQKVSLIDYPGKIATILFTPGCNYNCYYCHNTDIIRDNPEHILIDKQEIIDYINKRKSMIDALVISGGEPTLQADLIGFIKKIKETGLLIKLDTNGTRPEILRSIIDEKLLDYIAMDIKAPFEKYSNTVCAETDIQKIKESIDLIINSAPDYEFRTTVSPDLTSDDLEVMASYIKGSKKYVLQQYRKPVSEHLPEDPRLDLSPYPATVFYALKDKLEKSAQKVELRGL